MACIGLDESGTLYGAPQPPSPTRLRVARLHAGQGKVLGTPGAGTV